MKDSNLKKCPNCNSFVSIEDRFCRVCGHDFSKDDNFSSEGKTFEDFLLEASKYRSESQNHRNKFTIDDQKSSEKNHTNYDKEINSNNQDTTDRLSVTDIESESELLKEQRKKAFEETNNDYYNDYEYYEYEDEEKSSILKKILFCGV